MKKFFVFILVGILLSHYALAYPAIVVFSGSITSPTGRQMAGYNPTMKIFNNAQRVIYDSGTQYAGTILNGWSCMYYQPQKPTPGKRDNLQSGLIDLTSGQTYSVQISFQALCTRSSTSMSTQSYFPLISGNGCWGRCTADDYKNYKVYSRCVYYQLDQYKCNEFDANYLCAIDLSGGPCTGERQSAGNPVSATSNSPDIATFGDDTPITFTAP